MIKFETTNISRKKIFVNTLVILLVTILVILAKNYSGSLLNISECKFKVITGLSCPTCGMTRAFLAFLDLDIFSSLGYHLLAPFFFAFAIFIILKYFAELLIFKEINIISKWNLKPKLLILTFVSLISFWIIRIVSEVIG
ncbi:MAG: DUF2752 domain-containing protein [Melioribacteraceae bacterium]|nr:DUF2752 domain-containing protein [Melioribacteraceae bacterium]